MARDETKSAIARLFLCSLNVCPRRCSSKRFASKVRKARWKILGAVVSGFGAFAELINGRPRRSALPWKVEEGSFKMQFVRNVFPSDPRCTLCLTTQAGIRHLDIVFPRISRSMQ